MAVTYLKDSERNVPKAIGFAGANIWLPRYIKLGCELFILEVEKQFVTGGQIKDPTTASGGV